MPGYIYKITNIIDGKSYIGVTSRTVKDRLKGHLYKGLQDYKYLHNAINKHGKDNFTVSILYENEDIEHTKNVIEPLCIQIFNTHYSGGCGYNLTYGGEGTRGYAHTKEAKSVIAEAARKSAKNRKPMPQERREKMSKQRLGKPSNISDAGRLSCSVKNSIDKKLRNPGAIAKQKSYEITYENGEIEVIKNMRQFCKNNGYSVGQMHELINLTIKCHRGIVVVKRVT